MSFSPKKINMFSHPTVVNNLYSKFFREIIKSIEVKSKGKNHCNLPRIRRNLADPAFFNAW